MKFNHFVEFNGKHVDVKKMEDAFKEIWKNKGGLIKDIKTVDFYFKPEEDACYYVVQDSKESGKIPF